MWFKHGSSLPLYLRLIYIFKILPPTSRKFCFSWVFLSGTIWQMLAACFQPLLNRLQNIGDAMHGWHWSRDQDGGPAVQDSAHREWQKLPLWKAPQQLDVVAVVLRLLLGIPAPPYNSEPLQGPQESLWIERAPIHTTHTPTGLKTWLWTSPPVSLIWLIMSNSKPSFPLLLRTWYFLFTFVSYSDWDRFPHVIWWS